MHRESAEPGSTLPPGVAQEPPGEPQESAAGNAPSDLAVGLIALLLGLAYLGAIPSQVSPETDGAAGVSGRTLPYLIGGILALLGAALTAKSLWRRTAAFKRSRDPGSRERALRATQMVGIVAGYWLGVTTVGYVIASAVALLVAMRFSGARTWWTLLLVASIVPPLMYWFFHVVMQIPLPEAPLF